MFNQTNKVPKNANMNPHKKAIFQPAIIEKKAVINVAGNDSKANVEI